MLQVCDDSVRSGKTAVVLNHTWRTGKVARNEWLNTNKLLFASPDGETFVYHKNLSSDFFKIKIKKKQRNMLVEQPFKDIGLCYKINVCKHLIMRLYLDFFVLSSFAKWR